MGVPNPRIEWCHLLDKECLKFTFGDHLANEEAESAIAKWRKAFQARYDEKIIIVWDCLSMRGYETEARAMWTRALSEMKPQIESIWLITNSTFVKMGAAVMGMLNSLNIHVVKSESDIRSALTPAPTPFLPKQHRSDQTDSIPL